MHCYVMLSGMERKRTRRSANAETVLLQARVAPVARAAVQAAAQESGVSVAYYMEKLILQLEDEGGLPLISPPRLQRETLAIAV
jgi:hypothetical protein